MFCFLNCLYNTTKIVVCQYYFRNYFTFFVVKFSDCVLTDNERRSKMVHVGREAHMIEFSVKVELAKKKMTQKELAEKTGIRPPTVSAICLGTVENLNT